VIEGAGTAWNGRSASFVSTAARARRSWLGTACANPICMRMRQPARTHAGRPRIYTRLRAHAVAIKRIPSTVSAWQLLRGLARIGRHKDVPRFARMHARPPAWRSQGRAMVVIIVMIIYYSCYGFPRFACTALSRPFSLSVLILQRSTCPKSTTHKSTWRCECVGVSERRPCAPNCVCGFGLG
jgi:hypothetical protein